MNDDKELSGLAQNLKIRIHDPFADFLQASPEESRFEISLLDCYRLAGHACPSVTGAFLSAAEAVNQLFPETKVCERGDLTVELGSELNERASGPRANVIGYITGAWGDTGFAGLDGKFGRKGLLTFGQKAIARNAIRFRRISTGKSVDITFDMSTLHQKLRHGLDFPQSWRKEIVHALRHAEEVVAVSKQASPASCSVNGCC